ncbi:MAG: hypothetical protein E7290_07050 [Lachnospiraceae bacterium]|nr:hypothetical protein [Lachnospiraceae bacterium]
MMERIIKQEYSKYGIRRVMALLVMLGGILLMIGALSHGAKIYLGIFFICYGVLSMYLYSTKRMKKEDANSVER